MALEGVEMRKPPLLSYKIEALLYPSYSLGNHVFQQEKGQWHSNKGEIQTFPRAAKKIPISITESYSTP